MWTNWLDLDDPPLDLLALLCGSLAWDPAPVMASGVPGLAYTWWDKMKKNTST
jgi:hypothetical protein